MSPKWMKLGGEGYFLSPANPCATVDQRELEEVALRVMARPEVRRAHDLVSLLWKNGVAWPMRAQMDLFDAAVEEYVFFYVLRAVNSDTANPKVLRYTDAPGHWFGHDVPGSRWGGSSANFIYRCIPIEHGGRYEIHGMATCAELPTVTYSLTADAAATPSTYSVLDSQSLVLREDGGFVLTIDAEPANGRVNHIQTRPVQQYLQIRDALGDWLAQSPNALRVRRLDSPQHPPMTEDEIAQRAARMVTEGFYYAYYTTLSANGQAPNNIRAPSSSAAYGGMASQWGCKSNLHLAADDALILTANDAGALFRDVSLCNVFFTTLDFWAHINILSMKQMARDEDGRFTYVIAHHDPGVHNWLDTGGRQQLIFGHRWQSFPPGGATETPVLTPRLVKFTELERALPPGVTRIDAAGRSAQLASRAAGFQRRYIDV
jgi:hypothetical protein